jgi:hypothetical protein
VHPPAPGTPPRPATSPSACKANFLSERGDGTPAAERFFGQMPRDLLDWLLERLPDLPRRAARRPKTVSQATAKAG